MSTSFERPSVASSRQNSTASTSSSLSKTWKKIKQHHEEMNDAFATYYGGGRRSHEPWNSNASTPRGSVSSLESEPELKTEKKSLAKKLLTRAKEHHKSMNAAYRTYYGP